MDAELRGHDVRLTMGGEPTFVSIDDMDGEEWNTAASGPTKRRLAGDLLRRLQARFAPGAALHYGQGKWYPGEPLPRWALSCFWRADGVPVWRDPALLAGEDPDQGQGLAAAARFVKALALRLGLADELIVPGHEDTFYYLWKEGALPANVDPSQADLDDPAERRRLAMLLQRGLGTETGYALPLRWIEHPRDGGHWQSSRWTFRRGRMYLLPGDSPMGYRLPLDSLPWVDPKKREARHERSLFAELPPLGDVHGQVAQRYSALQAAVESPTSLREQVAEPDDDVDPTAVVHTALCVEPRGGRLHVFLPPLTHLEHWLDLIASIEATAAELRTPLVLEGYEPPRDWRLLRFQVTPDPGVIEVNVHPAAGWGELRERTDVLYEEARCGASGHREVHARRAPYGHRRRQPRHPRRSDSRPTARCCAARSCCAAWSTYWQHHPSLSYLFSGLFIGPTSQAPRVDEARDDSLYELEIAFQQMPPGETPQPWLVDRLLRHLLIDVTGNTHRAEFCIDKLYSPDTSTGRLGLVELRAFEMPPHARMSLVQQLLLRALIARFWQQPYERHLLRWGTALHDRFMLPHYRLGGSARGASASSTAPATRSPSSGSRPSSSSAFRATAASRSASCSSSCARRSSPGTCWARR